MKKLLFAAILAPALFSGTSLVAQTPYVETTSITFYWGFGLTYISNTSTPVPALPDMAVIDPNELPTGFETYTDTGRVRAYTGPIAGTFPPAGANRQIIDFMVQKLIREGQISKTWASLRWQFTAVREAPSTVSELASNPYRIFLTAIDPVAVGRPSVTVEVPSYGTEAITDDPLIEELNPPLAPLSYDTGITITLGAYSGAYTESDFGSSNAIVRNARGAVSTAFTVEMGARFYEDPLHAQNDPKKAPFNYHLKRNLWTAYGSGLISYNVRTIPGPLSTFVATNVRGTATGWFRHARTEVVYENNAVDLRDLPFTYAYSGIAPLSITMGNVQYQKRQLFPSF